MKTFRVAVAVAVVLTVICVQQTSSVQLTEEEELEEPVSSEVQAAAEEMAVDSWRVRKNKSDQVTQPDSTKCASNFHGEEDPANICHL
uniref:Uncharacterized protein n=1 Tax=Salarias fasciatus TaxID=181472 RepID=A0A672HUC7_SALFA